MTAHPVRVGLERNGKLLRLRLDRPKANVVDSAMIAALRAAFDVHAANPELVAVLLDHSGPNFSFGASIEEHFPDRMSAMLSALHGLLKCMLTFPCPILVSVRGQCLGGGLEVALAGTLIFAAPTARLGQPEIKLGVFAPAASCLLPERIGQAAADDLLFSGRSVSGKEAVHLGIVNYLADDPEAAAFGYFEEHLESHSACALRLAVQASRAAMIQRVSECLDAVERLCVEELVKTHDVVEGLQAFLERRPPNWLNR